MVESKVKNERKMTKGRKTQEKILQSAIICLAKLGPEKTTFQAIADHCGLSQPLVVHYFKKRENVFPSVVEYLLSRTQSVINDEIGRNDSAANRLKKFIRISLQAVREDAEAAKVFLILSFVAAFEDRFRATSAQLKQLVMDEITEILASGIKTKEFRVDEVTLTARMITFYLTGVRMNMLNEKSHFTDEQIITSMQNHCLALARYQEK